MFTVEMEEEETTITSLDETCDYGDVKVVIDEDAVSILQYDSMNELEYTMAISMSHQQFADILAAMKQPVGAYYIKERLLKV